MKSLAIAYLSALSSVYAGTYQTNMLYKVDVEYQVKSLLQGAKYAKSWAKSFDFSYYYHQHDSSDSVDVMGISASWAMEKVLETANDERTSGRTLSQDDVIYDDKMYQIFRRVQIDMTIDGESMTQAEYHYVQGASTPPTPQELEAMSTTYANTYMLPPNCQQVTVPKITETWKVTLKDDRTVIDGNGAKIDLLTSSKDNSGSKCNVKVRVYFAGESTPLEYSLTGLDKKKNTASAVLGANQEMASIYVSHVYVQSDPACTKKGENWRAEAGGVKLTVNGQQSFWYLPGYAYENKSWFWVGNGNVSPDSGNPVVCGSSNWCLLVSDSYGDEFVKETREPFFPGPPANLDNP